MKLKSRVMLGETRRWCLVLLATATLGSAAPAPCQRGRSWWDRRQGGCVPCTLCDPAQRLAVKLPCELHRDTVCHSLYELKIFPFNVHTTDEPSDYYYEYVDYAESEDSDKWDVQTSSTLTLAVSGCVVFFVVVLCMTFYHAKQWRTLKQVLKSDVRDLSAKLKLMEAVEPRTEPATPNHHIYCNIHLTKDALLGPQAGKKGLGNVYTQEKHS